MISKSTYPLSAWGGPGWALTSECWSNPILHSLITGWAQQWERSRRDSPLAVSSNQPKFQGNGTPIGMALTRLSTCPLPCPFSLDSKGRVGLLHHFSLISLLLAHTYLSNSFLKLSSMTHFECTTFILPGPFMIHQVNVYESVFYFQPLTSPHVQFIFIILTQCQAHQGLSIHVSWIKLNNVLSG